MSDQYGYGSKYQQQLVALALRDPKFLAHYQDVLRKDYFSSSSAGYLIEILIRYFNKYGNIPDLDNATIVVRDEASKIGLEKDEIAHVVTYLLESSRVDLSDADWIKDKAIEFAQFQEAKNVVVDAAGKLQDSPSEETYLGILTAFQKVISIGSSRDVGIMFNAVAPGLKDLLAQNSAYNQANKIATGIPRLDKRMFGGLGRGELGVVMAASGKGKSMVLVSLAAAAVRAGHNVYYYSLELGESEVILRLASNLTKIPMEAIIEGDVKYDTVIQAFVNRENNTAVKFFPARTVSASGIRSHLSFMSATTGVKPSLVLVDYADLLSTGSKGYNSAETSAAMGRVYEELRAMAHQWDVPVWTASQVRKSAWSDEIIDTEAVAESVQKINTADAVVTISQSQEEKERNEVKLYVAKLRNGKDGGVIHCFLDKGRATLTENVEKNDQCDMMFSGETVLGATGDMVTTRQDHTPNVQDAVLNALRNRG